jgi:hypothetical protein
MRFVINLLKRIGPLRVYVQGRRRKKLLNQRLDEIRAVLRISYKAHLDERAVVADYALSLANTDRQCCQVLLLEDAMYTLAQHGIKGALVECGVFTGGASAYMLRSALRYLKDDLPAYWGFDSFDGMPHATVDDGSQGASWLLKEDASIGLDAAQDGRLEPTGAMKAGLNDVRDYLHGTGYPAEKLNVIPGWFQDTLPKVAAQIGPIAVLRLDGDFYESTRICLEQLSSQVVPGGIIIFDDYGAFEGCKKATDEWVARQTRFSLPIRYDNHQVFIVTSANTNVKQPAPALNEVDVDGK